MIQFDLRIFFKWVGQKPPASWIGNVIQPPSLATVNSAPEVNVTMLAADAYGPVDFYQLTLRPSSHDL